jgi:hypothetical protein
MLSLLLSLLPQELFLSRVVFYNVDGALLLRVCCGFSAGLIKHLKWIPEVLILVLVGHRTWLLEL